MSVLSSSVHTLQSICICPQLLWLYCQLSASLRCSCCLPSLWAMCITGMLLIYGTSSNLASKKECCCLIKVTAGLQEVSFLGSTVCDIEGICWWNCLSSTSKKLLCNLLTCGGDPQLCSRDPLYCLLKYCSENSCLKRKPRQKCKPQVQNPAYFLLPES